MTDMLLMMVFSVCSVGSGCCSLLIDHCSDRVAKVVLRIGDALWFGAVAAAAAAGWMMWRMF